MLSARPGGVTNLLGYATNAVAHGQDFAVLHHRHHNRKQNNYLCRKILRALPAHTAHLISTYVLGAQPESMPNRAGKAVVSRVQRGDTKTKAQEHTAMHAARVMANTAAKAHAAA